MFNYANFSSISKKLGDCIKYYLKNTTVFNFNVSVVVNFNAISNFLVKWLFNGMAIFYMVSRLWEPHLFNLTVLDKSDLQPSYFYILTFK